MSAKPVILQYAQRKEIRVKTKARMEVANMERSQIIATSQWEFLSKRVILSKVLPELLVVAAREMEEGKMNEKYDPSQYIHVFEDMATSEERKVPEDRES